MRRAVIMAVAGLCLLLPTRPAAAATTEETAVAADVNAVRAGRGLPPLASHPELEVKAEAWAAHLAAIGGLQHSESTAGITADWKALAENVAVAPTAELAEAAMVAHPQHYLNIVDPAMTHIGIGVASAAGQVYVVQEFMGLDTAPPASTPLLSGAVPAPPASDPGPVVSSRTRAPAKSPSNAAPTPRPTPRPGTAAVPAPKPESTPPAPSTTTTAPQRSDVATPAPAAVPAAHIATGPSAKAEVVDEALAASLAGLLGVAALVVLLWARSRRRLIAATVTAGACAWSLRRRPRRR